MFPAERVFGAPSGRRCFGSSKTQGLMTKLLKRWNINTHSVYFRILVNTIAVMMIPILLLYMFIYAQTSYTIDQQSRTIDMHFLQKTQGNAEQTLRQIQLDGISLANSSDTISFVFSPQISDYTLLQRLGQNVSNLANYNSLVKSAYIYSASNGMLMTSDFRYYSSDQFYDQAWLTNYEHNTSSAYWTEPRTVMSAHGEESTCISLILHVPSGSRKHSGAVVINLDAEKFAFEVLSGGLQPSDSGILVMDQEFRPIFGGQDESTIVRQAETEWMAAKTSGHKTLQYNGTRYLLTYVYSSLYNWYFVRISQSGASLDNFFSTQQILLFFLSILLLAFLLAIQVSKRLYRPVRKLTEEVTGQQLDHDSMSDEYGAIHAEYSKMQSKTSALESEITALQPLIRERFSLRLLRGQADGEEEQGLAQFGFSMNFYAVFIVHYVATRRTTSESSDLRYFQVRSRLEDILRDSTAFRFTCVEAGGDTIAAIINFKEELSPMDARSFLLGLSKFVRQSLSDEMCIDTVTGFGPLCRTVTDIPGAYTAALKSIRFKLYQDSDDMVQEDDEIFAPYSPLLQELLEEISGGDTNYVRAALDELFRSIRKQLEALSQFQIQQIAAWVLNSVVELLIQNKLKTEQVFGEKRNLFTELRQMDDLDTICKWLEGICLQAAEEISLLNAKQSNQKIARIQEYIEQHISEDISLNDVAAWVGLSPAYVSRTFKKSTGQNFVEYLNICRVEQAKQLLKSTQLSIKEIGFKSGFNSMQSFIRTFKKLENCTPSQYRDVV